MMEMGRKLAKHPQIHVDPAKALIDAFLAINEGLNTLKDEVALYSGSTAVVMLIRYGHVMPAFILAFDDSINYQSSGR